MAKEKPNKRWVVRRCGSLSPEAGVTHRSWNYARGYVVSTTTTDELQKMEPWQGQSQGNTSWVGNGEISCYRFYPCLPPAPYPSALPGIQLRRALGSVRAKQETVRQGGTRSGYISLTIMWIEVVIILAVQRSLHSIIYSFSHQIICVRVLPTMCKIISLSFKIYLELFKLFQALSWVNFVLVVFSFQFLINCYFILWITG